jgi:hypothetical protein
MTDLKTRLREAEGADRELDKQIWQLLVPNVTRRTIHVDHHSKPYDIDETRDASGRLIVVPSYTASIDAALALVEAVLPNTFVKMSGLHTDRKWRWSIWPPEYADKPLASGSHEESASALCLALLSALEKEPDQ